MVKWTLSKSVHGAEFSPIFYQKTVCVYKHGAFKPHCLNYEAVSPLLKSLNISQTILFDFGQNSKQDILVYKILVFYTVKFSSDMYNPPTPWSPSSVFKLLACFSRVNNARNSVGRKANLLEPLYKFLFLSFLLA